MNAASSAKVVRSLLRPEYAVRQIVRRLSIGSLDFRLSLQALDRPQYAFGVKHAITLASKLKLRKVSVVEFGVAKGEGLLTLERYAEEFGKRDGIEVEVYGFDTGVGLPEALDYRDLGYVWKRGAYRMDVDGLKARLKRARLMLGDVKDTAPEFLRSNAAPVGFISFDLDYYTSTIAAFQLFRATDDTVLPRVLCYFDDVISDGHMLHCEQVGELRAIREFNRDSDGADSLEPIGVFNAGLAFPAIWTQQLWVYHRFGHRDYNRYIGAEDPA